MSTNQSKSGDESEKRLMAWWNHYFPHEEYSETPDPGLHVRTAWKVQQAMIDRYADRDTAMKEELKAALGALVLLKNKSDCFESCNMNKDNYIVNKCTCGHLEAVEKAKEVIERLGKIV